MAVLVVPRAVRQIATDLAHDALDDLGPHARKTGRGSASVRVEYALGMRPKRTQHPVRRVARNRHRLDDHFAPQPFGDLLGARKDSMVEFGDLRQVLGHQPHRAADARIVRQDHHAVARDSTKLSNAARLGVVPVVHGQNRHRGIDTVIV